MLSAHFHLVSYCANGTTLGDTNTHRQIKSGLATNYFKATCYNYDLRYSGSKIGTVIHTKYKMPPDVVSYVVKAVTTRLSLYHSRCNNTMEVQ